LHGYGQKYHPVMKTVNSEAPSTRILPSRHNAALEDEASLVASGALKTPAEEIDWSRLFLLPAGNVSQEMAGQVAIDSRGDR
jgi:hypothetical protein